MFTYGKAVQAAVVNCMNYEDAEDMAPNVLLGGLCKVKKIRDAQKVFDEMLDRKAVPTLVTCNTLIDG